MQRDIYAKSMRLLAPTRRLWREADKTADMVEMEESEQVGVGAGACEGQDNADGKGCCHCRLSFL